MKNLFSISLFAALVIGFSPMAHATGYNGGGGNNGGCNNGGGNGGGNNGGGCNNNGLQCDAGGPYTVDAAQGIVTVVLDGTGSNQATSYHWSTNFPGALFVDADVAMPTLTIPVSDDCSFNLTVTLTVKKGTNQKTCSTTVRVRDHVKPVITCPDLAKLFCGSDISPEALGYATATDNCDQNVTITYHDTYFPPSCPADRFEYRIERKWKATDNDCNKATCIQQIDVVKNVTLLDVLPGVCPNTYDRNACSTLPVAILGTAGFDVTKIEWNTVRMYKRDCVGGNSVKPECFQLTDAATEFYGGAECDCSDLNGDGKLDLVAKFSRNKINQAFGLNCQSSGQVVQVVVTGRLCNGCHFLATDCFVVQ